MTSANTIEYTILDKNGKQVGRHSQNIMCKRCNDGLEKFTPASDYSIHAWGYDEEEEPWEGNTIPLDKWLLQNTAEITFKPFIVGDRTKAVINGRKSFVTITNSYRGKADFFQQYDAIFDDGTEVKVSQTQLIPLPLAL